MPPVMVMCFHYCAQTDCDADASIFFYFLLFKTREIIDLIYVSSALILGCLAFCQFASAEQTFEQAAEPAVQNLSEKQLEKLTKARLLKSKAKGVGKGLEKPRGNDKGQGKGLEKDPHESKDKSSESKDKKLKKSYKFETSKSKWNIWESQAEDFCDGYAVYVRDLLQERCEALNASNP